MLHEITHTSIGLEDIHPPAFYELLDEIRQQYYELLRAGEVDRETDEYGCQNLTVTPSGEVKTIQEAAREHHHTISNSNTNNDPSLGQIAAEGDCGVKRRRRRRRRQWRGNNNKYSKGYTSNVPKRRPLLKGAKMLDGRTKAGREAKRQRAERTPRELAARAALARLEPKQVLDDDEDDGNSSSRDEASSCDEEEEPQLAPHPPQCGCRGCVWESMLV